MKIVLTLLAMITLALSTTACGGGGDEAAIEDPIRDFVAAFEDRDPDVVLGMFSSECTDLEDAVRDTFESFEFEFALTGIDVLDLEGDSAIAGPQGKVTINDEETDLLEADLHRVVRENGEWKVANCNFFDVASRPVIAD